MKKDTENSMKNHAEDMFEVGKRRTTRVARTE